MPLIMLGLVSAVALSFAASAGPAPRDASTNKPSAEACAAARAANRELVGCENPPEAGVDSAMEEEQNNNSGGRDRFMVCPQDPRCPR